jgi:hypothetical protein
MASKEEENRKRAERFILGNHGPALTEEEKLEKKKRKLQSLAKTLEIDQSFTFGQDSAVVPSLELLQPYKGDFSNLQKQNRKLESTGGKGISTFHRAPADVGDATVYNHIMKTYVDEGFAPNFSAVAEFFHLSANAPRRMYDRHVKSFTLESDPLPHIRNSTMSLQSKQKLVEEVAKFQGAKQEQRAKPKWIETINDLRLESLLVDQPNASIDDIQMLDARTYAAIMDALLPEECSTTKMLGAGRIDAQQVPYNAISCCAVIEAAFENTAKEVIFSSDMFTCYVDPTSNKAQIVRCPEGTLAALRAQKVLKQNEKIPKQTLALTPPSLLSPVDARVRGKGEHFAFGQVRIACIHDI